METIRVHVYVPLAMAVAGGRTLYGDHEVVLGEIDLRILSAEAKSILGDYVGSYKPKRLEVADATPGMVCGALEVEAKARLEAEEKRKHEFEATIAKMLAAPDDDWISPDLRIMTCPRSMYVELAHRNDPRVLAHRKALETCPS